MIKETLVHCVLKVMQIVTDLHSCIGLFVSWKQKKKQFPFKINSSFPQVKSFLVFKKKLKNKVIEFFKKLSLLLFLFC